MGVKNNLVNLLKLALAYSSFSLDRKKVIQYPFKEYL